MKKLWIGWLVSIALAGGALADVTVINDTFGAGSSLTGKTDLMMTFAEAGNGWNSGFDTGWVHGSGGGFMYNLTAVGNSRAGDGAIATMVSLSGLGLGGEDQLNVNFNYSSWGGDGDNPVQVHLWLVNDNGLVSADQIAYIGAKNGRMDERSAFTTPAENFDAFHVADGSAVGFNDVKVAFDATDTGDQAPANMAAFDQTFDVSGLADYDYFVFGVSRDVEAGDNFFALHDVTVTAISEPEPAPRPAQPNLVLILADDLGWQDIKVYDLMETNAVNGFGGTNCFETPYMDALASEGTLFTHAYSPSPVCSPSRAAILSGKHPARTDVTSVAGGKCPKAGSVNARGLSPHYRSTMKGEEITLPEMLDAAGYFTGMFGKWHIEQSPDTPGPDEQGFNRTFQGRGMTTGVGDRLAGFATTNSTDTYQLDANGFAKDEVTEEALSFLADAVSQSDPFFCYYSTWLVHAPWQIRTESLLQKYSERMGYTYPLDGTETFAEGQNNPFYGAMVESFDYYMSRLITYLEETDDPRWPGHKLIENTYVILTSDNGGMEVGDVQGEVTDNYPLDKGKIWIKEGGTRVPFIAVGPGIASNTVSDVVVNGLDLYPTFLALAGESIPDERLDGCDLSDLLLNDPQDPAQVTEAESGDERESMFWHFPHSGRVATTLVKDGWKLYKNYDQNWTAWGDYSLYQLYAPNGDPVDIGEQNDLINSETAMAAALIPELEAWIEEVDARPQYLNPERGDTPLDEYSPRILSAGNDETMAWVTWNTDKAEVKYLDLLYTRSPAGTTYGEEWFKVPVPFTHSKGWAEVEIPEGAQRYLFNLIDENRIFESSVYLTGHSGYDSEMVPLRAFFPQGEAAFADAGTVYPTNNVLFGNTVGGAFKAVRDDYANLQVLGQTFTVTEPVRLSALTLQAYTGFNIGSTDAAELYLWIGKYESGAPVDDPFRTRLYQKIDMRGVSCVASNYYTIDFDDTVLTNGTYAFQLKWKEQASGNNSYWMYSNGGGTYADGDVLHILTTAGSTIDLPFSDDETAGSDLVFALHGTIDYFGEWIIENGLDRAPEENPYDDGLASGGLQKNSVFFTKGSNSAWTMADGVLSNTSTDNNNIGEGAVAKVIDLTDLDESDRSQLSLSFDYTTGDAAEKLYVHLWGYEELSGGSNPSLINLGAQNGAAWVGGDANMVAYNLGKPDGVFTGSAGAGFDAAAILTGSAGAQSYSNTFDVSTFTTAPDAVSEYDYLVLAFAREIGGTAIPGVSIGNISLSIVGGAALLPEAVDYSEDGPTDDPNGDGLENLLEYALGGDPTLGNNDEILPIIGNVDSEFEYIYRRRRDAATRGLVYDVQMSDNLPAPSWGTAPGAEDTAVIDADFEAVTNRIDTAGSTNGFLRLSIEAL